MSFALYMGVQIPRAVTEGLRLRGISVLTAQEDGMRRAKDPVLLDRSTELDRLLVTQDDDFLTEAATRSRTNRHFRSIIHAPQIGLSIGEFIRDLEIVTHAATEEETYDRVIYVPLQTRLM